MTRTYVSLDVRIASVGNDVDVLGSYLQSVLYVRRYLYTMVPGIQSLLLYLVSAYLIVRDGRSFDACYVATRTCTAYDTRILRRLLHR